MLGTGIFVLWTIAPTLGFPNPFTDATTARPYSQAKAATATEGSEIWESLLENSATDEYQARVIG